jgi:THO complex subunit 4
MQYGPSGRSLGSATVIFAKSDAAAKAVQALDNIRIDNRLIKVELIMSAKNASVPAAQNSLANRVSYALPNGQLKKSNAYKYRRQPKKAGDKPKPATATKDAPANGRGRGRTERGRGGRGGRVARDKKKTVEELDAEMEDYFPAGEGGNDAAVPSNGATAPQAAGGDTAMDDEML